MISGSTKLRRDIVLHENANRAKPNNLKNTHGHKKEKGRVKTP